MTRWARDENLIVMELYDVEPVLPPFMQINVHVCADEVGLYWIYDPIAATYSPPPPPPPPPPFIDVATNMGRLFVQKGVITDEEWTFIRQQETLPDE